MCPPAAVRLVPFKVFRVTDAAFDSPDHVHILSAGRAAAASASCCVAMVSSVKAIGHFHLFKPGNVEMAATDHMTCDTRGLAKPLHHRRLRGCVGKKIGHCIEIVTNHITVD